MTLYETLGLDRTVRVNADGSTEHGIDVPHVAANIACGQVVGEWKDHDSGITYPKFCKKRVGHHQPEGEAAHVPVDRRYVAAPRRVVHTQRFAPNRIPAGVDLDITAEHDCANHLD
jgi:hypothetical protein